MAAPKGNRYAAKPRHWENALKRALARAGNGSIAEGLNGIAEKVVAAAQGGDQMAWREIADRLDGKAVQAIESTVDLTTRKAQELTDDDLADIATGSSAGTADAAEGPSGADPVH